MPDMHFTACLMTFIIKLIGMTITDDALYMDPREGGNYYFNIQYPVQHK